jgi:glycerophosphoryl diester phosphodiesterase
MRETRIAARGSSIIAGERMPTLGEVLHWAHGRTKVVIEIKQGPIFYPNVEQFTWCRAMTLRHARRGAGNIVRSPQYAPREGASA